MGGRAKRTESGQQTQITRYRLLACHLYRADLEPLGFYPDWEAHRYCPYGMDLACDLQEARKKGLIKIEPRELGRAAEFHGPAPEGIKNRSPCCATAKIQSAEFIKHLPTPTKNHRARSPEEYMRTIPSMSTAE